MSDRFEKLGGRPGPDLNDARLRPIKERREFGLSPEAFGALFAGADLTQLVVEDLKRQGVEIRLIRTLGSGSFSDTALVGIDGQEAAMKVLGGANGIAIGLAADSLSCDVAQFELKGARPLKANPKYFGKVSADTAAGPKTVAYFKEFVDGENCLAAICRGRISKEELLQAVREIFKERIEAELYVWDMNPFDFLLRPEPAGGGLVERLCLIDPCTPPLSSAPGVENDPLDRLIESFSAAVDDNLPKARRMLGV